MLEIIVFSLISFIIGIVVGAKIYKNLDRLEKWARFQLKVVGVPLDKDDEDD